MPLLGVDSFICKYFNKRTNRKGMTWSEIGNLHTKLKTVRKYHRIQVSYYYILQITGAHLCQCHLQMECTQTDLTYLMSYVPETKVATYFPVQKNHILCEIMMEILIHIYENKSFQDPWAHFEHPHLKKLGNQLVGSVPSFENTRHFRSWVNSVAKSTLCISF